MIRRQAIAVGTLSLFLLVPGPLQADPPSPAERAEIISELRTIYQAQIRKLREVLFNDLPPGEKDAYEEIEFSLTPSDFPDSPGALVKGGQRRIEMTVGFCRAMEMMGDALGIEVEYGRPEFLPTYVEYVSRMWARNIEHRRRGEPSEFVASPYDKAHLSDTERDALASSSSHAGMLANSLGFVLAHEVAHHVRHHTDHPTDDKRIRRRQEREADGWAAQRLVAKGLSPIGGIVPLLFDFYGGRHPAAMQDTYTHPADVCRLRAMTTSFMEALPRYRDQVEKSGSSLAEVQRQMRRLFETIEEEVGESGARCDEP